MRIDLNRNVILGTTECAPSGGVFSAREYSPLGREDIAHIVREDGTWGPSFRNHGAANVTGRIVKVDDALTGSDYGLTKYFYVGRDERGKPVIASPSGLWIGDNYTLTFLDGTPVSGFDV